MATVRISNNKYYKASPVYQWDLNHVLKIYGANIARPFIHFSNSSMGVSINRIGSVNSSGVISVTIPNSLLQKTEMITVYICGYEGDNFKTYYKIDIPITPRKKPGDYTLNVDDDEVYSFTALEKLVNDSVNNFNSAYNNMTNAVNEYKNIANTLTTAYNAVSQSATNNASQIENLKTDLPYVELWVNPDPNTAFVRGDIRLDLRDYARIVIILKHYATVVSPRCGELHCTVKNLHYIYTTYDHTSDSSSTSKQLRRSFVIKDDRVEVVNGNSSSDLDNNACIPYKIIGFKY